MNVKLLRLPAEELLLKFGLGGHKPGSGSAAAYQGLLSAQLIRTVISLTNEEKRRSQHAKWLSALLKIDFEIETRIYPELYRLFHEDSAEFDKHIRLLQERDAEQNPQKRDELSRLALQQLVPATEIPLGIARLCIELGDYALFVFENGFKFARGDAAVALNGARASATGCLSIVDLNLSKFGCDDWTIKVRSELEQLSSDNQNLSEREALLLIDFRASCRDKSFHNAKSHFSSGRWEDVRLTNKGIEEVARQMQNVLWEYRDIIWRDEMPGSHIDVLKPEVAIEKLLGYQFGYASLGRHLVDGREAEIAGQIDKEQRIVIVSRGFKSEIQNFTAAHELGHAILHKGFVLHRDSPLDGSEHGSRDIREIQANKFATYFLMPAKQVRLVFEELFLTEKFVINDNTVFALGAERVSIFKAKVKSLHGLARHLAGVEHFRGQAFRSMSEIFNVSISAMAIRLEELDLLEF